MVEERNVEVAFVARDRVSAKRKSRVTLSVTVLSEDWRANPEPSGATRSRVQEDIAQYLGSQVQPAKTGVPVAPSRHGALQMGANHYRRSG